MEWTIIYHEGFRRWLESLSEDIQDSVLFSVALLEGEGPLLTRPHVDTLRGSRYPNMKELRVQHRGSPLRVLFAFDWKRQAILLLGGDKTADSRWYKKNVPIAETRYQEHLEQLRKEGK
jgi:hypothetical protein